MISGIFTAVPTPFLSDGDIDWGAFERILMLQFQSDVRGVVLGGLVGESPTLMDNELDRMCIFAKECKQNYPDKMIIAEFGTEGTQSTLRQIDQIVGSASAGLLVLPRSNRPDSRGLIEHLRQVVNHPDGSLPLIIRPDPDMDLTALAQICQTINHEFIEKYSDSTSKCRPIIQGILFSGSASRTEVLSDELNRVEQQITILTERIGPEPNAGGVITMVPDPIRTNRMERFLQNDPIRLKYVYSDVMKLCNFRVRLPLFADNLTHRQLEETYLDQVVRPRIFQVMGDRTAIIQGENIEYYSDMAKRHNYDRIIIHTDNADSYGSYDRNGNEIIPTIGDYVCQYLNKPNTNAYRRGDHIFVPVPSTSIENLAVIQRDEAYLLTAEVRVGDISYFVVLVDEFVEDSDSDSDTIPVFGENERTVRQIGPQMRKNMDVVFVRHKSRDRLEIHSYTGPSELAYRLADSEAIAAFMALMELNLLDQAVIVETSVGEVRIEFRDTELYASVAAVPVNSYGIDTNGINT